MVSRAQMDVVFMSLASQIVASTNVSHCSSPVSISGTTGPISGWMMGLARSPLPD